MTADNTIQALLAGLAAYLNLWLEDSDARGAAQRARHGRPLARYFRPGAPQRRQPAGNLQGAWRGWESKPAPDLIRGSRRSGRSWARWGCG
jgi:hypothetical protein